MSPHDESGDFPGTHKQRYRKNRTIRHVPQKRTARVPGPYGPRSYSPPCSGACPSRKRGRRQRGFSIAGGCMISQVDQVPHDSPEHADGSPVEYLQDDDMIIGQIRHPAEPNSPDCQRCRERYCGLLHQSSKRFENALRHVSCCRSRWSACCLQPPCGRGPTPASALQATHPSSA